MPTQKTGCDADEPPEQDGAVMATLARFPPSFEGNPWSYGFALFNQPGKTTPINVADTLDEIDGLDPEEAPAKAAPQVIAKPIVQKGE
ncbi:hypothetical protein K3M67_02930 [Sphingobium sp. V4]|uniref:hypothetical protein n=1 Tax=Sphingobium sp. V4 TaxID=3038927 RepID=UPI00255832D9|nr:hypothetical protein [Sphingobium sp. V4]WIW88950.1 hypothetical protein K3M67_02930 [Sphingobium sp. V4]